MKLLTSCPTVNSAIATLFGSGVSIKKRQVVGGGCINATTTLELSDGNRVFLKENSAKYTDMFLKEANGLAALCVKEGPTVPKPLAVYSSNTSQYLLMSHIQSQQQQRQFAQQFGRAFAFMHLNGKGDKFGFFENNYIGSTPQHNTPCSHWPTFFAEQRLGFQIKLAQKQRLASAGLVRLTNKLIERIDTFLPETVTPSILHGDLWSGNVMTDHRGQAAIIDPAVYYGHFEADLAMTQLFGGQDRSFYDAYNEINPISDEYFDFRKDLYNLYHILNHLNLFGASYASQAMAILKRLV